MSGACWWLSEVADESVWNTITCWLCMLGSRFGTTEMWSHWWCCCAEFLQSAQRKTSSFVPCFYSSSTAGPSAAALWSFLEDTQSQSSLTVDFMTISICLKDLIQFVWRHFRRLWGSFGLCLLLVWTDKINQKQQELVRDPETTVVTIQTIQEVFSKEKYMKLPET